jgi:putative cell wall-binding protein
VRNTRVGFLRALFVVVALVMGVLSPISLPGVVSADEEVSAPVTESVAAINDASDDQAMRAALDVFADFPTNSATPYGSLDEGRKSAVATDMLASKPSNGEYTDQTAGEMFGGLVAFRVEVARAVTAANSGGLTVPMLRDLLATTAALPSGARLNGETLTETVLLTFGSLLDVNGDKVVADVNLRPSGVTYQSFTQMILQGLSGVVLVDPSRTVSGNGSLIAPYPNLDDVRGQLTGKHTIVVGSGSVTLTATLNLNGVSLIGAGASLTTINYSQATGLSNGIQIDGADVTLRGFTLTAAGRASGAAANYAIKTRPGVEDLLVEDVAVANVQKTAFDVNSVVGAVYRNVTVSGVAAGFGMAIAGARDVLIDGLSVTQAAWGDVGVFPWPQTNGQLPENIRFQGELAFGGFTVQSILAGVTISTTSPTHPGFVEGANLTVPDAFSSLVSVTCQNGRSDVVVRPADVSALLGLVQGCTLHTVADTPTPVRIVRGQQIVGGFSRISEAVAAASSGDRIEVSAGTYNEDVDVDKSLTLRGANAGVNPNTGTRGPESTIVSSGDYAVEIFASDVLFDGFSVNNSVGNAVRIAVGRQNPNNAAVVNNVTVSSTIATGAAILSCPTCTGLYMGVLSFDNFEQAQYRSENIAFLDNRLTVSADNGRGITMAAYNGSQLTGVVTISGNHILTNGSPTSSAGIELRSTSGFSSMQNVAISGNTIEGFDIAGVWPRLNPTVNISGNTFAGNVHDIRLDHNPANNNNVIGPNSFSGSSSAIRNNTTANIDISTTAVGSTFGGIALTGDTSLADLFAIEDQIIHKVDVGTLGFVRVKAAEVFVTANSFRGTDTPSIQRGVDAATAGDTVHVASGTYTGNVSLSKNGLTLRAGTFHAANVSGAVTIAADDVTVQGLRISSTGDSGVIVSGNRYSPRILDNIIEDPSNLTPAGRRGVLFSGWRGTAEVSRNNISGFTSAAFVQGTIAPNDSILIRENTVFDLDSGNTAFPNDQVGGTALYERNTILGPNVRNGISMLPVTSKVMVRGNTIRHVTGIAIGVRGSEVTIVDNDLSENDRAISVRGNSHVNAVTTLLVRNNNLSNATTSAVTLESGSAAGVLRAAENFWGTGVTPTVSAGVVGPTVTDLRSETATDQVIISPWLDAPGGRPVLLAGSVAAVVTDVAGAPLSGVTITLDSATTAATGTDGRASFSDVSAGQYTVAITPGEGRLAVGSVIRTVSVTADSAALVEFTLATLGSISGRVTDTSGNGVSGVTVAITDEQVVVVTGVDGSYVFSGRNPGTAVVSMTPPVGYLAVGRTVALVNLIAGSSAVADFQVIQTGRIAGRVVDSTGVGVAGVPVLLNGAAPVVTSFDGGYAFTGQTPGGYTVTLGTLPNGFVAARAQALVNLSAGSSAVADFQLTQTGRIGGRVVDSTGVGVAGVPVSLNGATPVLTGLDGSYVFTGQNPGSYTVTLGALPAGFAAGSATRRDVVVAPGGSAIAEFLVVRTGVITGRITDLSGAGISGISVAIGSSSTTTGLDGRYEFAGLNPGAYSVALGTLPGNFLAEREITTRTVNLAAGQGARADFRLVELGVVTGRVVDETGAGISGVTVTVNGTPMLSSIDGSYRLGGLVAGSTPSFSVEVPSGFALPTGRDLPTVTVGQIVPDVVLLEIGVVAGYAYLDLNGNDQRDPGEPPLAGVIATLTAGAFSATATTSADGFYRFDDVPVNATVTFSAPTGFVQADPSLSQAGLRLSSRGIMLMNGGNSTFVQDVGLLPAGTVLGYVSLDGDPLAGVTITVGGNEQLTSQDGVALFSGVAGSQTMSVAVPDGFELAEGQPSRSVTPGTAPLQEFKMQLAGGGQNPVQTPPPSTVIPEVRQVVPVVSGPVTSVAVTTAAGRVDLVFTGVASTTGTSPEVVVRPLGHRTTDRGVLAAGQRFSITAERFTFAEVEVCLPVERTAVAATQAAPDRVRLIHTRSDGSEHDVTTTYVSTGGDPRICGVASEFSTFQAVVVASERIAGADRYATAAQVAAETHPNGASLVYIASGNSSADALAAGAAAAVANAPLLLVSHGLVPVATVQALEALAPTRVVVVGGTAAISSAVQTRIRSISGATVDRIGGADRYETAALLATDRFPTGAKTVYVVTGQNFPDALAAGAVAGQRNAAVVLVPQSGVPESVGTALQGLNPDRIIVVGGVAAVSAATFVTLQGYADQVDRIGGVDRYDTAARLTLDASPGQPLILVTGQNFPDALVAATLARRRGGAVLMVANESVPGATRTRTAALAPSGLVFIGGPRAITPTVEVRMVRLLNASTPGLW